MRDIVLKSVHPRIAGFLHRSHGRVDLALFILQGLQLPAAIVDDPHRRREPEIQRALPDRQRVLGRVDAAAHHAVDVHMKLGVLGQQL